MAEVQYRVLGPLEAASGDTALSLGGKAPRTLLAVLLLRANEVVSVDAITDALWADSPPQSAAHAIHVHVSNLRKALGADAIEHTPAGYALHLEPRQLDLTEFEALVGRGRERLAAGDADGAAVLLQEALALWRGAALQEFVFADFARAAIARLEELRLAALEARIEADLRRGRHEELVAELTGLASDHPENERVHGMLMLALYRSGRQSDALAAYRAVRERLDAEYGLEPSPALRELERSILTHEASVAIDRPAPRSIVVVAAANDELATLVPLVEPLAHTKQPHELVLARLVEADVTGDTGRELAAAGAALAQHRSELVERGTPVRTAAFTTTDRATDIMRFAGRAEVDLLLLSLDEAVPEALGSQTAAVLSAAPCDTVLWVGRSEAQSGPILVPFGAVDNDWAALELGAWLSAGSQRPLIMLGTDEGGGVTRDASRMLADAGLAIQRASGVAVSSRLVTPGPDGLAGAAEEGCLLIVGLSERWATEGLGETRAAVARAVGTTVLFVKRGLRPSGVSPTSALTRYRWSVAA